MAAPTRLAGDLWSIFNFDEPTARYLKFGRDGRPALRQFVESIVLHPRTFVPTEDFMSLANLVGSLGSPAVIQLLESGKLGLVRVRGSIAYIGNGGGLRHYHFVRDDNLPDPHGGPADSALSWALGGLGAKASDPALHRLALAATYEVNAADISDAVRHETYMDVLNSRQLRNVFALRNTDMNHLAGIGPSGVRIYGGANAEWSGDEIDVVLAIAVANIELRLAQLVGAADTSTATPIGHVMRAKAERSFGRDVARSFTELSEIADVPDLGEAVLSGAVSVREVLKLSESTDGLQFRDWFHQHCRSDTLATAREYALLLKDVPRIQSFPVKVLRFLATAALGKVPLLGEAASAIDSFFVERWLRGASPKYFLEEITGRVQRGTKRITRRTKKRERNRAKHPSG